MNIKFVPLWFCLGAMTALYVDWQVRPSVGVIACTEKGELKTKDVRFDFHMARYEVMKDINDVFLALRNICQTTLG